MRIPSGQASGERGDRELEPASRIARRNDMPSREVVNEPVDIHIAVLEVSACPGDRVATVCHGYAVKS